MHLILIYPRLAALRLNVKTFITVAATLERHPLNTEPPAVQTHQPGAPEQHLTHHQSRRRQFFLTMEITIWKYEEARAAMHS